MTYAYPGGPGRPFKKILLVTAALAMASPGVAQDAPPGGGDVLEEIIVTGVRASLNRALDQKRSAAGVVDGISAEDIADFPDLNISESLQRVTGVTINRVMGEGQQVSVRGLAPELTQVTLNGQTIASGNAGREMDFDVFASELFNNVQLTKTPSADVAEGGLAASIDLRTARPFDFKAGAPVMAASLQMSRNQMRDKNDPRASALISNRFMDDKLGVLLSASYSESSLRLDAAEGFRFLATDIDMNRDGVREFTGVEIPFIPRYVLELRDRERTGVTGAVQFRPTADIDLNLDVAYAKFDELRTRYSIDGMLSATATPVTTPIVDASGLVRRATYNNVSSRSENLRTPSTEDLALANVDAEWRFADDWALKLKAGYSEADKAEEEYRAVYQVINQFTYDLTDPVFVALIPQAGVDFTRPADFSANQSRYFNTDIRDRDFSYQFDLSHELDWGIVSSIQAGARFNERRKRQDRYDGRITFANGAVRPTAAIAADLPVDDFLSQHDSSAIVRNWFVTDFDAVFADPVLNPANFAVPRAFIDSWDIEEKSKAAYAQANLDGEVLGIPVRGNAGVRFVSTDQTSRGFLATGAPIRSGQSYDEMLPSLNLVAEVAEDVLLRAAASKSLTRPTLTQLSPGGRVSPTALSAVMGNPGLRPFTATQADFSAEWYFSEEALLSATLFRKKVASFITNVTSQGRINAGTQINDAGQDVSDAIYTITQPVNGQGGTVKGFELSIQTPFTFLPAPFDGLGVVANYTYADSSSTVRFGGETIKTLLPGQSRSSYNLVGYYEQGPFSIRAAYAWRDEYLDEVRAGGRERSNFTGAYGQLDMGIQYAVTESITLTADALNLLEAEPRRYAQLKDRNVSFSETGRFFIIGARAKF